MIVPTNDVPVEAKKEARLNVEELLADEWIARP
jgi:hypothetical protein